MTHLVWRREQASRGYAYNWEEAKAVCLDAGWRLPTRIELQSIVDYGKDAGPALDTSAFSSPEGRYWSASLNMNGRRNAWIINFDTGGTEVWGLDYPLNVRCVRCAEAGAEAFAYCSQCHAAKAGAPVGRYVVDSTTVFDTKTGLTWQRYPPTESPGGRVNLSWDDAQLYCQNPGPGAICAPGIVCLPGTGWRLPTVKELESLFDPRAPFGKLDPVAFPGTVLDEVSWSSTPYARDPAGSFAWLVADRPVAEWRSSRNPVRCVR